MKVRLFLELEFGPELEFHLILLHIVWNSSFSPNLSLPNSSFKNSLTYKIVSNACYAPNFFSKKLLFRKFCLTLILFHCIRLPDSSQMPFVAWFIKYQPHFETQCQFLSSLLGKLYGCRFMQIDKQHLIRGKPTRSIIVKVQNKGTIYTYLKRDPYCHYHVQNWKI